MSGFADYEYPTGFDPLAALFVVLFSGSTMLLIAPLVAQTRSKNLAMIALLVALLITCVLRIANALIWGSWTGYWWDGNLLCDVEVKLLAMLEMVIGGAAICISRDMLYLINKHLQSRTPRETQHRRTALALLIWCFVIPSIRAAVQHVVSPARYALTMVHGCTTMIDPSWPTIVLYTAWPTAIAAVVAYYQVFILLSAAKYTPEISWMFGKSTGRVCDPKLKRMFQFVLWMDALYFFCLVLLPLTTTELLLVEEFSWGRIHPLDYWLLIIETYYDLPLKLLFKDVSFGLVSLVVGIKLGLDPEVKSMYKQAYRVLRYETLGRLGSLIKRKSRTKNGTALSSTHHTGHLASSSWVESTLGAGAAGNTRYSSELTTLNNTQSRPGTARRSSEVEMAANPPQNRSSRFTELA